MDSIYNSLVCIRVPTTVLLVRISHLAVTYQMLTIRLAYMLELILVAPMGRLCLARFSSLPFSFLSRLIPMKSDNGISCL